MEWTVTDVYQYTEAFACKLDTSFNPPLLYSLMHLTLLMEISCFQFTDLPQASLQMTLNTLRIVQVNFYHINYNSLSFWYKLASLITKI